MTRDEALPARAAHAHCLHHSPGQRDNAQALVAWQSRSVARYFSAQSADPPSVNAAHSRRSAVSTGPDAALPQRLAPAALAWQSAAAEQGPSALGSLQLWAQLPDDVEWLDLTLSVHRQGQWWRLHPEVLDLAEPGTDPGTAQRLLLLLSDDEADALAAQGITLAALRHAASQSDTACWCCRLDGLGAFVAGLLDLGWPAPAAPS